MSVTFLTNEDKAVLDQNISKLSEEKVTLATNNGIVDHGIAGQFAISDGKGGITWKTLVEAEEVEY